MRKGEQPPWIVPDELRARIEPLLPVVPPGLATENWPPRRAAKLDVLAAVVSQ